MIIHREREKDRQIKSDLCMERERFREGKDREKEKEEFLRR